MWSSCLAGVVVLAACANVEVTDREVLVDEKAARPGHIYVYDFASTPEEVQADSALAAHKSESSAQLTAEQIALGQKTGSDLADAVVAEITAMGLPASHPISEPALEVNDLVIRGTLLSVQAGDATERVVIGMGKGDAVLKVAVEGFQMTEGGLRKVGSGTLDTDPSKTPGAAVPLVVLLATKNPLGLIVSTGVKLHDEDTGSSKIEGKVQDVAKEIGAQLRPRFEKQGWIAAAQ
jgi:hypothetical protein